MLEEILKELVEAINANTAAILNPFSSADTPIALGDKNGELPITPAEPEKPPRKKRRTKKQIAEDAAKLGAIGDAPVVTVTPGATTETPPAPATPQTAVEQVAGMAEDDLIPGELETTPTATMATPTIETVRDFAINSGLKKGALEVTKIIALYGENIDAIKPEHYERFMFDVAGLPNVGVTPPPPGPQA